MPMIQNTFNNQIQSMKREKTYMVLSGRGSESLDNKTCLYTYVILSNRFHLTQVKNFFWKPIHFSKYGVFNKS
jgi:hypothetical protein